MYNEELQNLYSSPNIIVVIKPRSTRLARHAAWKGQMRNDTKFSWNNTKMDLEESGYVYVHWMWLL
jgi:hypothetical protein